MRNISTCIASKEDNFLLLRFLAASLVIFGHCWAIALNPSGETDWLGQRTLLFSGTLAVHMFFFISGFLVTMSYERRHSLWAFSKARVLRVFPGLIACITITAVTIGPMVSNLSVQQYFADLRWLKYILGNGSLLAIKYDLPGVFSQTRQPGVVNGSISTIPGEMQMYIYVAALGVLGLLRTRVRFGFAMAILLIIGLGFSKQIKMLSLDTYYPFAAFFMLGAYCWMNRDKIIVSGHLLLLLMFACLVFYQQPGYFLVLGATTAYACLWFVYAPGMPWFNRFGDYSYGLYLYGWVMQQLVATWFPQFGPYKLFALSFPMALCCAIASWHLLEKPLLRFK